MSRCRLYSGKFRPDRDTVVKDGLALSIQQFGKLSLTAQASIVDSGSKLGDPGVPDPSWNVPPMCRRGITLSELADIYDSSDARVRDGLKRKIANDKFEKKVQQMQQSVEVNHDSDHGK